METRQHETFMRAALRLARRALGDTSPNPVVGAVIVHRGRVVGQGYHRRAGLAHAEVEALRQARERARGATLVVTLEPCNHVGRTPACCDALIQAGITQVVIAMKDPNPITNGRGIARLRRAGIGVVTGVLEEEAKRLNAPFAKFITTGMPFVIAKIAQSLDGKIATTTGESRWISSASSRALGHQLRRQVDAILVGVRTVLRDDPLLTARDRSKPTRPGYPIKVIVDSHLRTPSNSRCLSSNSPAPTIIATTPQASARKRANLQRRGGIHVMVLPSSSDGRIPLRRLCRELARRYAITSVLIEGGGEVLASALEERLVDRVMWCLAPIIIGGRKAPTSVGGEGVTQLAQAVHLTDITVRRLGPDLVVEAAVKYPQSGGRRRETVGKWLGQAGHAAHPTPHASPVSQ